MNPLKRKREFFDTAKLSTKKKRACAVTEASHPLLGGIARNTNPGEAVDDFVLAAAESRYEAKVGRLAKRLAAAKKALAVAMAANDADKVKVAKFNFVRMNAMFHRASKVHQSAININRMNACKLNQTFSMKCFLMMVL